MLPLTQTDAARRIDANKKNKLYLVLAGIVLTNGLIAEIIGVKLFSAEAIFGLPPARIPVWDGFAVSFNYTAGVLIWPVVFITSDIINEYFGPPGVKRISYLTVAFIAYAFFAIYLVTLLPPAQYWLDVNRENGLDINFAFTKIFRQGLGIIIGSLVAFLVGQILDAYVFQYLRGLTQNRLLWLRATGSTLVSQLVDSFLVLYIAFYVFGNWDAATVLSVGFNNYIYKFLVAILLTPVLYLAHAAIDKYLAVRE
ncbi:MAG: Putative preQ0 transporter YhhQ [uncultured Cytophagales bacterium]|uniref:Probable queuosine precursor transporter n=1 Tax=uncultured Cytophagales bacterium TaxID=158755 RepID=A0A6J4HJF0_9SPHI|nr:MAG: Putative preQ0 transporter YhhQ [uncultured Cytophagales bacterium]